MKFTKNLRFTDGCICLKKQTSGRQHLLSAMRLRHQPPGHTIVFRLIRMAMLEGCRLANPSVGKISFTRALTETRQLLKFLPAAAKVSLRASIRATYAQCCAHRVKSKPNRRYPGDRQEYRRKSRGPEKRRSSGRKYKAASPLPQPETRKDAKGLIFLLSWRHYVRPQ
jgi:hypothetical protein